MKKYFYLVAFLLALTTGLPHAAAQNLPSEMHFSADGRRLITGGLSSTGFYDESVIRTVEFDFPQTNYWSQLSGNWQSQIEIPATMTIDGTTLDSVGVRFKGMTSYIQVSGQKKSFAVSTDKFRPGQKFLGYDAFNFNNGFLDPSFVREVLYLHLSRNHIPSAKANYIRLKINGQDWGIYGNVQNLSGDYLDEWFLSDEGTRWRGERSTGTGPGGGAGFGAGTSSLNWLGSSDTALYKPHYTLKKSHKDQPWVDLIKAINALNNTPLAQREDSVSKYMDLDRTLWFLAHEIAFTDDDSYVFKGGMDYYLYWEPETGRLTPLEYDGNTCIDLDLADSWSAFYRQNDVKFALMNKLFPVPAIRQRYLAHMRTILEEDFNLAHVDSLIDAYYAFISAEVQSDPKKIYTYNQFLNEKQDLKDFFEIRRNFLLSNQEVSAPAPVISDVEFSATATPFEAPVGGQPVAVRVAVTSNNGIQAVRLYYATGLVGRFERTEMFDDGSHGDGQEGDGVFGGQIPGFPAFSAVRFYVEAVSNNQYKTAAYMPKGAEHDVYYYEVLGNGAGDVVINEFLADNDSLVADPNGQYEDWIELYNRGTETADLGGWFLSDTLGHLTQWSFPAGTTLAPGEYLIVWADEDPNQDGLHANFRLSAGGESLVLSRPDSTVVDQVVFGDQDENVAYARVPNGTGPFVEQDATFGFNNDLVGVHSPEQAPNLRIYPNPTRGWVTVESDRTDTETLRVFNAQGQKVREMAFRARAGVDLSNLPVGVYLVQVHGAVRRVVVAN
jgi:hypothetical protein